MIEIPWPRSTNPGDKPQEGSGRLINVHAEPRGNGLGPVWARVPGAAVFARSPSAGLAQGDSIALGVSHIKRITGSAQGDSTANGVPA